MAYIFRKNARIPFSHTFYDSTGGALSPGSARVWITYPPERDQGNFPYQTEMHTTSVSLTQNSTTLAWEGSWSSTGAGPGWVYYHIRSTASTLDVADGSFELRGNPAAVAST